MSDTDEDKLDKDKLFVIFNNLKLIPIIMISILTFILIKRFKNYEDKKLARIFITIFIGCIIYIISKLTSLVLFFN